MNCPKCGQEVSEGQKFCDGCGTEIIDSGTLKSDKNVSTNRGNRNPGALPIFWLTFSILIGLIVSVVLLVIGWLLISWLCNLISMTT